ncbi:MAG: glycosyltransferase family 4 protein [bacterium]|nr:glycosyltransferase family 4 protein [bacterium]
MKILFVSAVLPYPLYSGGQVRVYNLLLRLSADHEITLVTFLRERDEARYEKNLAFCKKIITAYRGHAWNFGYVSRSLLGKFPLLLASYDHAVLRNTVAHELSGGGYDLVHIEPWYAFSSIPETDTPRVQATHNIEYDIYAEYVRRLGISPLRLGYRFDVAKLRYWERRIWKRAAHVIAVSEDDAEIIRKTVGVHPSVTVVPNGVDVRAFQMRTRKKIESPVFLFLGSFTWMQNRDAVEWLGTEIWPLLRVKYPRAILRVVGRGMSRRLKRRLTDPSILLLDHVEHIEDELHSSDVLIAPIRIGGGTSFKILEAMASGLPVVTTSLGALGLAVSDRKDIMIGDSKEEIVNAVAALLASDSLRLNIARTARKKIERAYAWDGIAGTLERVWYETAKTKI